MLRFLRGGSAKLYAIGGLFFGAFVFLWRVFAAGKASEKAKQAKRDNQGWVEANDIISEARNARRAAARDDLMQDDGYRRPK